MSSWRARSCVTCSDSSAVCRWSAQASDGLEALEVIEEHSPDLVMLDIQMPGLTGFEVARRLVENGAEIGPYPTMGAGSLRGVVLSTRGPGQQTSGVSVVVPTALLISHVWMG